MFQAWQKLLPGFHWLSVGSFFLGLIESYAYGWYIALIWAPLYNVFALRKQSQVNLDCAALIIDLKTLA